MPDGENTLFLDLDNTLKQLLATTAPAYRKKLAGKLAKAIRNDQQKRIRRQKNPDESDYAPRKRKVLRSQKKLRFIYRGEVRRLRNWQASKGLRGRTLTGFDEDKNALRTFYRSEIDQFLDIDFSSVKRTSGRDTPMFRRLRTAHYMKVKTTADSAVVGFQGKAAAIARQHQYGLEGAINELAKTRYPKRELLGLSEHERLELLALIYVDLVNVK